MKNPNQSKATNPNPTAADPLGVLSDAVRAAYQKAAKADPAARGFILSFDGKGGFELKPNYDPTVEAAALADYRRRTAS